MSYFVKVLLMNVNELVFLLSLSLGFQKVTLIWQYLISSYTDIFKYQPLLMTSSSDSL